MSKEKKRITKIIDGHQSHWQSIGDGIIEGTLEGIKDGVTKGLKAGVKDGLKDCLTKGIANISDDDIVDILKDIPEEIIRNQVKARTKAIFTESTVDYTQRIFEKLVPETKGGRIRLSKEQVDSALDLIKKSQRKALSNTMSRLSRNPFSKDLVHGINEALKECLEEELEICKEKITEEITSDS